MEGLTFLFLTTTNYSKVGDHRKIEICNEQSITVVTILYANGVSIMQFC